MSNAFNNFLGGVVGGIFGSQAAMKDYQHADRLYVRENYARAPKVGFLYFVDFKINRNAVVYQGADGKWANNYYKNVGMLVKRADMPKFTVETETLNQYNRKTVVQKAIKYMPVTMDLHDDNSEITRDMWRNYYQYYFADSTNTKNKFGDTKYGTIGYDYGLSNIQKEPFFTSIDIYVMHQHKFSKYTLVNPMVTEWSHDTLDQADGVKILGNKMSIAYETVEYNQGTIRKGEEVDKFRAYYDATPSPISIGGNGTKTLFGAGGVIAGASGVFGSLSEGNYLGALVQANTLAKNARQLTKAGVLSEATGVIGGAINAAGSQGGNSTIKGAVDLGIASLKNNTQFTTVANQISLTKK